MRINFKALSSPLNTIETLTLLWIQQQNLSDKSPKELLEMYVSAYNEIEDELKDEKRIMAEELLFGKK